MTLSYFLGYLFVTMLTCYMVTMIVGGLLSLFWSFDPGRRIKIDFKRHDD